MYYRICDGLADKGKLVPTDFNFDDYVESHPDRDLYVSLFKYNEKHKEKFDKDGTISGIKDTLSNHLIFDFDGKDYDVVKKDAIELINRLNKKFNIPSDDLYISYSGNKGLHVEGTLNFDLNEKQYKDLVIGLAEGLSTFDVKINNASRVIRLPFTRHQVSGLYKTPMSFEELTSMNIKAVQSLAKDRYASNIKFPRVNLPKTAIPAEVVKKEHPKPTRLKLDLDFKKKPKWLSYWKYALQNGYFPEGTRSYALMVLAATYKSQGFDSTHTYHILKAAAEIQALKFGGDKFSKDEIYKNIISQVYSDFWNGGTYAEDSFPDDLKAYLTDLGVPRKDEVSSEEVFKCSDDVFSVFKDFAENIDKNTIKTGIVPLDKTKDFRLTTSMLVGVLGSPSSGKTSISLEIMRTASLAGQQVAFFSMDMGAPLVLQRLAQKVSNKTSDQLFDLFRNKNLAEVDKIRTKINEQFANVSFSFKTAMTTEGIRKSLTSLQEKTGEKIRIVVIDYLECISSSISEPTAKVSLISQELKDIATDFDTCVILLLQPPKRVGDPSKEILSYNDIKGAATVAQACSVVLSLWRDGFSPKTVDQDNYISFAAVKNRMGKLCQIDCSWNGLTGQVGELNDIERKDLEDLRKAKNNQNSSDDEF